MKQKSLFPQASTYLSKDKIILDQVRKNKSIIYGGRAIQRQIGVLARPTMDYDILAKRPKKRANQLQRKLDRRSGSKLYYSTPSKFHKGTHKVYHKGADKKRGTRDDIGIADFTTMRPIKTIKINGISYAHLSEIRKDKRKAIKDPEFEFRHAKDKEDMARMRAYGKVKRFFI